MELVAPRPGQVHRWLVLGADPAGEPARVIFEPIVGRRRVIVRPAGADGRQFRLLIHAVAVDTLLDALRQRESCVVPAAHRVYPQRTLGLCPDDPHGTDGAMRLYVTLPTAEHRTVFAGPSYDALATALTEIRAGAAERG